jgi:hypothetical protein
MARLNSVIALIAVIAVAVLLELQYQARHQLRSQSDAMREQFQQLQDLEAENIRLSNMVARAGTPLADEQLAELADLRQQVEALRHRTNDIAGLQNEIQRLRGILSTAANSVDGGTAVPDVPASDIFPRESWMFSGYDTPENTIQSIIWAVSEGDQDTYAAGVTPELGNQLQSEFEDGSFADDGPLEMGDVAGYRIVDRDVISGNQVRYTLFMDGPNEFMPITLEPTDNGWMVTTNGENGDSE